MKNRLIVGLGVVVIALTGIVIGQALPRPVAEAQPRVFRECISASLWHHDGAAMRTGFQARTVAVPTGWVPVGGGGVPHRDGGGQFGVILCR